MKLCVNRLLRIITASVVLSAVAIVDTTQFAGAVSQLYSVVFWANTPGSLATTSQTSSVAEPLVAFSSMGMSNPNYVFLDWNTQPNGGGTSYPDQATYSFVADLTLYAQWVQVFHSVTFYANTSAGDTTHQSETGNSPLSLTSIASLGFIKANYTFSDWNSQANGSGSTYGDGSTYSFLADITLYAQWTPNSETLQFSSNGGAGVVSSLTAPFGSSTSLPTGAALSKAGYSFTGWNTMPDGSGTQFAPAATLLMPVGETLYAQWALSDETLSFSSNSGSGTVASVTAPYGSSISLPTGAALSKAGYSFTGWNTMPDGSGTEMSPGTTFTMSAGQTLYATWSRKAFVVTFVTPGGHSGNAPISVPAGATVTLQPPASAVPTGYSFGGWFTALNGGQLVGKNGTSYTPAGSTALYAHWLANPRMRLGFSSNGGVGVVKARFALRGLSVVIPGGAGLHRQGFTFLGWSTTSRAVRPDVKVGARFLMTRSRTIYAMWRRDQTPRATRVLLGSVGTFAPNSSALTNPMRRLVATLALGIEKNRRTEVFIYGYTTSKDSSRGAAQLSMRRAVAVEDQLRKDLVVLGDVGVVMRVSGEARLSNSVLASFRNVEVFAN